MYKLFGRKVVPEAVIAEKLTGWKGRTTNVEDMHPWSLLNSLISDDIWDNTLREQNIDKGMTL